MARLASLGSAECQLLRISPPTNGTLLVHLRSSRAHQTWWTPATCGWYPWLLIGGHRRRRAAARRHGRTDARESRGHGPDAALERDRAARRRGRTQLGGVGAAVAAQGRARAREGRRRAPHDHSGQDHPGGGVRQAPPGHSARRTTFATRRRPRAQTRPRRREAARGTLQISCTTWRCWSWTSWQGARWRATPHSNGPAMTSRQTTTRQGTACTAAGRTGHERGGRG